MPGDSANSYGGDGHGDQPFTAEWYIPNATTTPRSGGLDFKDSTLVAEFNRIAQMLDWDNTDMDSPSRDSSCDHLNYGPYVDWPYPPSMPADYLNPGYIPIPVQNFSVHEDYSKTLPGDGLEFYHMNHNARINGTDANLSDKKYSNVDEVVASKVSYTSETGIADDSGCSCMLWREHKNGLTKDSKFLDKESVSSLIVTMQNLSELLVYHCSSETCELKEQDVESLEKVVDNLNMCMLKKIGRGSVSKLHQGMSIGKHSGSKDDTIFDSVSVESGSDMTTIFDKSDQAVKVLIKNLHEKDKKHQLDLFKNFSLKVDAPCDNLKIEMEECKPDNEKDVDEHSISELDGIDKLANKVKGSPVSLPGTACNSDSGDEFDDEWEEVAAAAADAEVFHSIVLDDCCLDWEFVTDEEVSGLNSSS